jgi:hypothetical protein
MPTEQPGPNVIDVNGRSLLLTTTGGGVAVHLTSTADELSSGRGAVPDFYFSDEFDAAGTIAGYDRVALTEPRWSQTTLCGRTWAVMVGGDGGAVGPFGGVAFGPSCRRCLTLIDRHFPRPVPDRRLDLVAELAADAVRSQRGYAEIHDVPGDQQDALRRKVRALIRARTGHPVRTYLVNDVVYVDCRAISDQHADDSNREAAEAISTVLTGRPRRPREQPWVISWVSWDIE